MKKYSQICKMIAALLVLFAVILGLAILLNMNKIRLPDSYDAWVGLLGAFIGGALTLIGVRMTIQSEEATRLENQRLENMPILGFKLIGMLDDPTTILTVDHGETLTSDFSVMLDKQAEGIQVSVVNGKPAFHLEFTAVAVYGETIRPSDAFAPGANRLVGEETIQMLFNYRAYEERNTNLIIVVRFSYEDLFGNKYVQDLPFMYLESWLQECGEELKPKQVIEFLALPQPVLVSKKMKPVSIVCDKIAAECFGTE